MRRQTPSVELSPPSSSLQASFKPRTNSTRLIRRILSLSLSSAEKSDTAAAAVRGDHGAGTWVCSICTIARCAYRRSESRERIRFVHVTLRRARIHFLTGPDKKKANRFTLKSWSGVAMWSWDICTDTCAICRNKLTEPSIEYQANPTSANESGLSIAWGSVVTYFTQTAYKGG